MDDRWCWLGHALAAVFRSRGDEGALTRINAVADRIERRRDDMAAAISALSEKAKL